VFIKLCLLEPTDEVQQTTARASILRFLVAC